MPLFGAHQTDLIFSCHFGITLGIYNSNVVQIYLRTQVVKVIPENNAVQGLNIFAMKPLNCFETF